MNQDRNALVLKLRPEIKKAKIKEATLSVEAFQNTTLRPIIKFQHAVLFLILKKYITDVHFDLQANSVEKTTNFITKALQSNTQLNLQITHNVTAFFTPDEFEFYAENSKEIHKRIIQICKERYLTNLNAL